MASLMYYATRLPGFLFSAYIGLSIGRISTLASSSLLTRIFETDPGSADSIEKGINILVASIVTYAINKKIKPRSAYYHRDPVNRELIIPRDKEKI